MERAELLELLRESLSVESYLETHYEGDHPYISTTVILSFDGEEISRDYSSTSLI